MIIDATANIEWLRDRLYDTSRVLAAEGINHPTFVLLTRSKEERQKVEAMIWKYFEGKFGDQIFQRLMPGDSGSNCTRFHLPDLDASVVLIDI